MAAPRRGVNVNPSVRLLQALAPLLQAAHFGGSSSISWRPVGAHGDRQAGRTFTGAAAESAAEGYVPEWQPIGSWWGHGLAARDVAAEGCGAAALDRRPHLELAEAKAMR
jgi:hypothetical protein